MSWLKNIFKTVVPTNQFEEKPEVIETEQSEAQRVARKQIFKALQEEGKLPLTRIRKQTMGDGTVRHDSQVFLAMKANSEKEWMYLHDFILHKERISGYVEGNPLLTEQNYIHSFLERRLGHLTIKEEFIGYP